MRKAKEKQPVLQYDLDSPARGCYDRSACEGDRQRSEEEAWRRGGYIGTTAGLDIGKPQLTLAQDDGMQRNALKKIGRPEEMKE